MSKADTHAPPLRETRGLEAKWQQGKNIQLRLCPIKHLGAVIARRLKVLNGLTPYEYICQRCEKEPERFGINPIHHIVGLNI